MLGKTHRLGGIMIGTITPIIIQKTLNTPINNITTFTITTIIGGAIGSLLPDLDHPNSIISKKIKPLSKIIREFAHHRGITHTLLGWITFGVISLIVSYLSINYLIGNINYYEKICMSIIGGAIASSTIAFIANSFNKYTHIVKKNKIKKISALGFLFGFFLVLFFDKKVLEYVPIYLLAMFLGYGIHILYDMFTVSGVPFLYPFSKKVFRFSRFKTGGIIEVIASVISIIITILALYLLFKYNIKLKM